MRLFALLVLFLPTLALAQGDSVPPPPLEEPAADPEQTDDEDPLPAEEPVVDAFTERLLTLVDQYHQGIGHTPTDEERTRALDSIRTMLLDGVALPRVHAAVEDAIQLNTPGRVVPFHIAVPLRVKPADADAPVHRPPPDPEYSPARAIDPDVELRRSNQRKKANSRRNRKRLHRQWQSRTRTKRTLLGIGLPIWAAGYAGGFGLGGLTVLQGTVTHEQAWLRAIPLVGQYIYFGTLAADGGFAPDAIVFGTLEVAGATLIVLSLALKADWPYERDPTALRLRRHDGSLALQAQPVLTPAFAGIVGRF
jgi:hypothetical protein